MSGIGTKAPKRFVCDVKRFAKGEEVAKIHKAVGGMANSLNRGVDEGDMEGFLRK